MIGFNTGMAEGSPRHQNSSRGCYSVCLLIVEFKCCSLLPVQTPLLQCTLHHKPPTSCLHIAYMLLPTHKANRTTPCTRRATPILHCSLPQRKHNVAPCFKSILHQPAAAAAVQGPQATLPCQTLPAPSLTSWLPPSPQPVPPPQCRSTSPPWPPL